MALVTAAVEHELGIAGLAPERTVAYSSGSFAVALHMWARSGTRCTVAVPVRLSKSRMRVDGWHDKVGMTAVCLVVGRSAVAHSAVAVGKWLLVGVAAVVAQIGWAGGVVRRGRVSCRSQRHGQFGRSRGTWRLDVD